MYIWEDCILRKIINIQTLKTNILNQAYLKKLKVQNFKSFADVDIELKNFNVIIGANASGKSNFVQVFNFLKEIREHGLDNAISLQGGIEYIRNFKEKPDRNLLIELEIVFPESTFVRIPYRLSNPYRLYCSRATWKFELSMGKRSGYKILKDEWDVSIAAYLRDENKRKKASDAGTITPSDTGTIKLSRHQRSVSITALSSNDIISKYFRKYRYFEELSRKKLLLEPYFHLDYLFPDIPEFFEDLLVYDFDPKLAKRAVPLKGKMKLESDASNLAIILRSVISNKESKRKFANLITDLLPFVDSVGTESFADKSILFTLTENYFKNRSLPSSLISDGTINITALIIALYFQRHSLTIFEEPERNIHPSLISKVISMMNETSLRRQILVTTHNPEIVRYTGLENLLAVRRNDDGFSEIVRPLDQEEIKIFLADEMEIEELYIQNILGG